MDRMVDDNYLKETETKSGMIVEINGFACRPAGTTLIEEDESGLFFRCSHGKHYIKGQLNQGNYVGLYLIKGMDT